MPSNQSWFSELAFGEHASTLGAVQYQSHVDALANAHSAMKDARALAVIIGPRQSGKTTATLELGDSLTGELALAVIDGTRLNARTLLAEVLGQFGYVTDLDNADELLKTVEMFATQQVRSVGPPVLIIDNADRMYPSGLKALNELAALTVQQQFSLRIVLTGQAGLRTVVATEQLKNVGRRISHEYELQPMTVKEAMVYLHSRLKACGVAPPDSVFPVDVCDRLHKKSGGWPGQLNKQAVEAIERAKDLPVTLADLGEVELPELPGPELERVPETTTADIEVAPDAIRPMPDLDLDPDSQSALRPPRIVMTRDGQTISTYTFRDKKVLIGRSEFADVIVNDQFVSKLHALLLLYRDALVLLDLNSANGVTVNSTVVRSTILQSHDVIMLGNHRLKVENAPPLSEEMAKVLRSGDTVKMKNLMDNRRKQLGKAKLRVVDN